MRKNLQISSFDDELDNMHDLNVVDDGTRALFFYDETKNLSAAQSQAMGFPSDGCRIRENSFREIDLTREWEVVHSWSSSDHVDLKESTFSEEPVEKCYSGAPQVRPFPARPCHDFE